MTSKKNRRDQPGDEDLSWIGVHVMAEVAFCRRAGVLAYEGGAEDTGDDFYSTRRLTYTPDYDLAVIEAKLNEKWDMVLKGLVIGAPAAVGIFFIGWLFDWLIALALLVGFAILAYWWIGEVMSLMELAQRRRAAQLARPAEPDASLHAVQEVNWWSLLKAGFVPVSYEQPFREGYLKLIGKPWRVLQRGSVRIPVFRKRSSDTKLHRQHLLRVAAYAYLIRQCEGGEVPYGVILFGDGCDGVAVPVNADENQKLEIALKRTRQTQTLVEEASIGMPPSPEMTDVCHGCPFGLPRRYAKRRTETQLRGATLAPFLTEGEDGKLYHSTCGDRFRWVPPHETAKVKRLC